MKRFTAPLIVLALLAGFVLAIRLGWLDLYIQTTLMFIGINVILAASLNLINGYMGEFSCGHGGFMCVGAYVSSMLSVWLFAKSQYFGAPLLGPEYALYGFPLVLLGGGLAAALAGLLVAVPSFRTRGDYLAIITLAANYIITSSFVNIDAVGGPRGFMGMKKVVNAMEDVVDLPWMFIWTFVGMVFSLWLLRRFVYSTLGRGVTAIHQDEIAAEIMSVNTDRVKLIAFMVSSGLAGVAGGLYGHVVGYVNPSSFDTLRSTEIMVMVYLGGMGSLTGSALAAVLMTFLLEGFRSVIPWLNDILHAVGALPAAFEISQVWRWVFIPLLLVILMQFRPEGLMGSREITDLFPRLRRAIHLK